MAKIFHPLNSLPQEYNEVISWIKELCRRDKIEDYVICDHNPNTDAFNFSFFTKDNHYRIICRPFTIKHETQRDGKTVGASNNPPYLGAQVTTRKPRAGEDWNRGNDLPDGKYCRLTWDKIKNAIIAYELVRASAPKERVYNKDGDFRSAPSKPTDVLQDPEGDPNHENNGLPRKRYQATDPEDKSGVSLGA